MHANSLDRILAVSYKELREPLVGHQAAHKVVSDRRDCVITAEARVERFLSCPPIFSPFAIDAFIEACALTDKLTAANKQKARVILLIIFYRAPFGV